MIEAMDGWFRLYADRPNNGFKNYPAPAGRYGDPKWPDIKPARIMRLAFKDKGRLIDSHEHPLVRKWAGRDKD